jgi:hypothetical protein
MRMRRAGVVIERSVIFFLLISFHGCRQARRSAFISYGARASTDPSWAALEAQPYHCCCQQPIRFRAPRPQHLAEVQTRFLATRKLLVVPYLAGTHPRRDGVVVKLKSRTGVAVRPDHDQSGGVRLRQHASEVYSGTHIDLCGAAAAGKCATTYFTTVFRQPSNPIC